MSGTQTCSLCGRVARSFTAQTGAFCALAKEARLGHHAMRAECARYPRDPSTSLGTTAGEKNQREGAGVTAFGQAVIESLPIII